MAMAAIGLLELNDAAILNLHVTPMPPIKFCLNLTYFLGGDDSDLKNFKAILDIGTDGL